jgi:hypothetical protein
MVEKLWWRDRRDDFDRQAIDDRKAMVEGL